ncbi:MAG: hypothetical protein B6241_04190 [Spirochaetaceae bacterium 4572_59]|nr:MAG: hypothetical protein B6241_04190 [Spirochaetaceae bacterium 4572_59]
MFQPVSGIEELSEDKSCFFDFEEDELFEQNIDDFDKEDNEYDDGITRSEQEDCYDEDLIDENDQPDFIDANQPTHEPMDELEDYDDLED